MILPAIIVLGGILLQGGDGSSDHQNSLVLWIPIITAGLALLGVVVTAVLTYRRGQKADEAAAGTTALQVAMQGNKDLVDQLQEQVASLREQVRERDGEIDRLRQVSGENYKLLDEQRRTIVRLEQRIEDLERKSGAK